MARVLLGASAGIAIYKAVDLASALTRRGDQVYTLLTKNATRFVTPLTFRAVTRQPVFTDTFDEDPEYRPEHISLSDWGQVMVLAPATADLIGRIAAGLGDDILTTTILAWQKPIVIAPAMNDRMWANRIVQENIEKMRALGFLIVDPEEGRLACGSYGIGRLAENSSIIRKLDEALLLSSPLVPPDRPEHLHARDGTRTVASYPSVDDGTASSSSDGEARGGATGGGAAGGGATGGGAEGEEPWRGGAVGRGRR
jgi:phosphopantothenoylcysteine synthetase/decarboxylase